MTLHYNGRGPILLGCNQNLLVSKQGCYHFTSTACTCACHDDTPVISYAENVIVDLGIINVPGGPLPVFDVLDTVPSFGVKGTYFLGPGTYFLGP